ncbi:DUF4832 domain-containing protein [Rubrobacter radiotolerans]|nr:DUF4832 domain-containing protein [Rubrobacter radiotolerans]
MRDAGRTTSGSPGPTGRVMSRREFIGAAARGALVLGAGGAALGAGAAVLCSAARATSRTFTDSETIFPNPERGWFQTVDPMQNSYGGVPGNGTMPQEPPEGYERMALTPERLARHRAEGVTLVRKYYSLYYYRDRDIPASFIADYPQADFDAVRRAGLKMIPRFIYNWNLDPDSGYDRNDATLQWILRHIGQISGVLRKNSDVIAHVELGLVGHYGEWHYSGEPQPNGHLAGETALSWTHPDGGTVEATYPSGLNSASRRIIEAMLDALPPERQIAMRYLYHIRHYQAKTGAAPLDESSAHTGSDVSRLGMIDDSLLHSPAHRGSYTPPQADRRVYEAEREFVRRQSRFAVQSGEPSGKDGTGYLRRQCPLRELQLMSWDSLNRDQYESWRDGVYELWRRTGTYDEIGKRLGYRFNLISASARESVRPGGTLSVTVRLKNTGFSAPYNARPVALVLRDGDGGHHEARLSLSEADARRWTPGKEHTLRFRVRLPESLSAGQTCRLFLWLPDASSSLRLRPEYAIRIASDLGGRPVWEPETGFNRLGVSFSVSGEPVVPDASLPLFTSMSALPDSPEPLLDRAPAAIDPLDTERPDYEVPDGHAVLDFADRPDAAGYNALAGDYAGVRFSGDLYTSGADTGKCLFLGPGGSRREGRIVLPTGTKLRSFLLNRNVFDGTFDRLTLTSNGRVYRQENPAGWWALHRLPESWLSGANNVIDVAVESDSSWGAENLVLDDLVYG